MHIIISSGYYLYSNKSVWPSTKYSQRPGWDPHFRISHTPVVNNIDLLQKYRGISIIDIILC